VLSLGSLVRFAARAAAAATALALWPILADAILVAPHAVFMDHRIRTGQVYLANTGNEPEEVAVELKYGYPDADSAGNVYIHFVDAPTAADPSAAQWIRAFPRRVVVQPNTQQTVRLLATPPADLPDGEYWSRLIVTSHGAPVPLAGADTAVRAQITLEVRTIISLNYRKGPVTTGLVLDDFRAAVERDSLIVWLDLTRTGNAAYLGLARIALLEAGGRPAAEWDQQLAVYVSPQHRRFAFPVTGVAPGLYTLRLVIATDRDDIQQGMVLQAPPIERTMAFEVRSP
jgi:hypothetical protein